jgi:DNA-binding MarR family transcriptional regulator
MNKKQLLYQRLHRALREYPRYNQFLTKAHGLDLLPVESHILVELDDSNPCSTKKLNDKIGLEKTVFSKLLKKLKLNKWIDFKDNNLDQRQKLVNLTKLGRNILTEFDLAANQQLIYFDQINNFSTIERSNLRASLEKLAQALNSPETVVRKNDHILRPPVRQLTRAFKLLGRRAMGSELNTLEWQILLTMAENSELFLIGDLGKHLGVSKINMALAVKELLKRKYITKIQHKIDQRAFYIKPSKHGIELIEKVEFAAIEAYKNYFNISEKDVEIVERWIRSAAIYHHLFVKSYKVTSVRIKNELDLLRKLTIKSYLEQDDRLPLPESCFSHENFAYCLHDTNTEQLKIACEVSKQGSVINLYYSKDITSETLRAFVLYCLDKKLKNKIEIFNTRLKPIFRDNQGSTSTLGRLFY